MDEVSVRSIEDETTTLSASSADSLASDGETTNTASSNPPIAVYLYAGDQIIENVTTGYLYFEDSLGNTSHVTDAAGNLLESYTYDAFGTPTFYNATSDHTQSAPGLHIKHLFQGQLWTQETGLNDYRNRVELPTMGVFLQPDPVGFKGDAANIYRFCNNNGVNRTHPMGLIWIPDGVGFEYVRDFDNIPNVYVQHDWHKDNTGVTLQRLWINADVQELADGTYTVIYHDVEIRSHSYIRTHYVKPFTRDEWDRCPIQMQRTRGHEYRQQRIDKKYYETHKDAIRKDVEGGNYKSRDAAKHAISDKEAKWKQNLIDTRNDQGRALQRGDGLAHESPDCGNGSSSAKNIDHSATGGRVLPGEK
jgi:RHS repeat-associated protein